MIALRTLFRAAFAVAGLPMGEVGGENNFPFAGGHSEQSQDGPIRTDPNQYTDRWVEELDTPAGRAKSPKAAATSAEVSQLRGLIGALARRSSQTRLSG